ncbi:2469_t:CDS:2 [Ambispora gerdemannii]|uniref:2469_t:CDS:1 n=1 Tax=Ambispora gerdemannii TaxID=144530 RepID=A0A9N9G687_9GLOM|nr:2469_t:CDS:2 [Ambispora gerdemannii]
MRWVPRIKKLNLSFNNLRGFVNSEVPSLTHLDVRSNALTNLDLRGARDLVELNCSNNTSLTNFSFPSFAKLNSFDCLDTKLIKSDTTSSNPETKATSAVSTETVYLNNPALTMGLGAEIIFYERLVTGSNYSKLIMEEQAFRYYLSDYTKEITEELPKLKAISDIEKQSNETSFAHRKYCAKLDNLIT